jgi:hypothetical protein
MIFSHEINEKSSDASSLPSTSDVLIVEKQTHNRRFVAKMAVGGPVSIAQTSCIADQGHHHREDYEDERTQ